MKLRLVLTALAVLAATILPTAASARQDHGRGHWLSLPPDLTTKYLQGHYPHRYPVHPNADYRHRKLGTADNHGVDRFNGEVETIPAGDLCDFDVELRNWGATPFWEWTDKQGEIVHAVANPDGTEFIEGIGTHFWVHDKHRKFRMYRTWHLLFGPEDLQYEKYFRDRTSVWDGTATEINGRICEFLTPRAG
jgi:hypothetical protein